MEQKLFNIYFFGDKKSSEKLFENIKEKEDLKKEIEIHGEKINLNIIEHPDISIVSTEEKKANGILLFFDVNEVESFNKLKETIEKIIDMNKYEMPLIVVGNNPNNQERKINYNEAKNFLDKYGIKYHEINTDENKTNIESIFNDLGEQVLYQEVIDNKKENENENDNIHSNESIKNNDENKSAGKENKTENDENKEDEQKNDNIEESPENVEKNLETETKEEEETKEKTSNPKPKKSKKPSIIINKPFKPKIKSDTNDVKEKKTLAQIQREELVRQKRLKREREMEQWYKKKEREGIELKKKKEKEGKKKLFEKLKEDKENQKKKEKEVKEEFSSKKKERYEKSKKEREEEEKKFTEEKKINKIKLEQKLKSEKANYMKLLNEKEQSIKENIQLKRSKIISPTSNNRNRPKKSFEFDLANNSAILNKTISEFNMNEESIKNKRIKNIKNNFQTLRKFSTSTNTHNKPKPVKSKSAKHKKKEKEKNEQENKENEKIKNEKEILEKENKLKEELEQNYINNSDIYRCIYCSRIPLIKLNESDHNININCICQNSNYKNNFNYEYFIPKSLNHPMTEENIKCNFCQKKLNELKEENIDIKFCDKCNNFICEKDNLIHNDYHDIINQKKLKEKYKKMLDKKNVMHRSKTLKPRKSAENKNNKLTNSIKETKTKNKNKTTKKEKKEDNKNKLNQTEIIIDNINEKLNINDNNIPLYLIDSCCIEHNKIFNKYCFNCNKNICSKCEEKHKEHNLINLSEIEINEEDILNVKQSLEKEINDLKNVNDYFLKLIEKLKNEFNYIYQLKQKEIEIKQKIIQNYETIKYNYNSIKNIQNIINEKNNFTFDILNIEKKDTLTEINSIFNLIKKNSILNKKEILLSNINKLEISDIIKLKTNEIAISSFNGILDIYNNNNELILRKKFFYKNEGINCMIQLKNGYLALGGKKIKIVNYDLNDKICDIVYEINIKNGFINSLQDLGNNFLVSYDSNHELKLWKNYKFIAKYNNFNIDSIYKINGNSFITSSLIENKINLFKLENKNNFHELISFPLSDEINIKKGKNSFIKINNSYFIFIYEKIKKQENSEEKFEESKNNEDINIQQGICLVEIYPRKNYFKILDQKENIDEKRQYMNLVKYINEQFLLIDDNGLVEIWEFDIITKNIYMKNKFDFSYNIYNDGIILNANLDDNTKDIVLQTNKYLFKLTNY